MYSERVLKNLYNTINLNLFDGRLPVTEFSVRDYTKTKKGWSVIKDGGYVIVVFDDELLEDEESIYTNLLHQCVHIFNWENGVNDTSRNNQYHNKKFKEVAQECGLITERSSASGFDTCGIKQWTIEKIDFPNLRKTLSEAFEMDLDLEEKRNKRTSAGRIRYVCPKCKRVATAGSTAKLICGYCNIEMI